MRLQLTVIIVSYNVKYFLELCLCSVMKAAENIECETIVVDNASKDDSVGYLTSKFPECIFIANKQNTGFAKANNQALAQAKGAYILFLNPDILLPEDCFTKCIQFFESDTNTGACGVRMLDGQGKFLPESKRGFPSPMASFYKLSGLTRLFPRSHRFARYYLGHLYERKNHQVDVLAGAFMMVKKNVLEQTGGFDEKFFMYGEDIDLSYRIQQKDYANYYLAETSIIHFKGESTKKGTLNYVIIFYRAMIIFVHKHFHGSRSRAFSAVLKLFIWGRALLSASANLFPGVKQKASRQTLRTLVIGSDDEAGRVIKILQKPEHQLRQVRHKHYQPGIERIIQTKAFDEVIFCDGSLTYKNIIELMDVLSGVVLFKIYSHCSGCIIASDNRNTTGSVLV